MMVAIKQRSIGSFKYTCDRDRFNSDFSYRIHASSIWIQQKSPVGDMNKWECVSMCVRRRWRQRQQRQPYLFMRATENSKDLLIDDHAYIRSIEKRRKWRTCQTKKPELWKAHTFPLARTSMPLFLLRYLSFNLPIFIQKLKKIYTRVYVHTHFWTQT